MTEDEPAAYARFRAPLSNARSFRSGVFGLVNGLSADGKPSDAEEAFRRESNDWFTNSLPNPSDTDPLVYDRTLNPGAEAWFKVASTHLTDRVAGYLDILRAHGVPFEAARSDDPGEVIYEDADQIVVIPNLKTGRHPKVTARRQVRRDSD